MRRNMFQKNIISGIERKDQYIQPKEISDLESMTPYRHLFTSRTIG